MLTLYRTPIVLGSNPGARVCFLEVENLPEDTPEGYLFIDNLPKRGTWPAIENAADPDKMPVGEYELVMTRMASSKRPALWLPDTELFGHAYARDPWDLSQGLIYNRPEYLKGCWSPCKKLMVGHHSDAPGARPDDAMADLFEALGGWEENKRIPFRCVELGELPTVKYEVDEIILDGTFAMAERVFIGDFMQSTLPGERWTRLPDGVLVEQEVK